jgi:peptide/nickel transport system permease protein
MMAEQAVTLRNADLVPFPASAPSGFARKLAWFVRRKPLGAFGLVIILVLVLLALFPSAVTSRSPNVQSILNRELAPSSEHWMGTDQLGRDVFTRVVYGARTSVVIGFGVVLISSAIATLLGTLSGYLGGWFDTLVQRLVDIGIALPGLIFIILVVTSLQQIPLLTRIIVSVGTLISLGQSRIIRAAVTSTKTNQFVEAARVTGAGDLRIMVRHVLPNVVPIIIVAASIQIGGAILIEASLSFLGYGIQPPTASWGRMLNEAQQSLVRAPYLAIFPGLAIFLAVFSFNMLGDALRDVLDPRMRNTK